MGINITINGQAIVSRPDQSVLEAAYDHGIEIPALCYQKDLSPVGSCRLCMVEVKGLRGQIAACTLIVNDGMVVETETAEIRQARREVLDLLLLNYVDEGYTSTDRPDTEFLRWVREYGAAVPAGLKSRKRYAVDSDPNPFIWVDMNKCILCTRCVRACSEVQGRFVWVVGGRGYDTRIIAGTETDMLSARCESCGACVAYCPTGALDDRMAIGLSRPDSLVTTTCTYCGVGCQLDLNIKDGQIIQVTSNPHAPVNGMHLCVKGRYGYDFVSHPHRLTEPLVRSYLLNGKARRDEDDRGPWVPVDWDTALDIVAQKMVEVKSSDGPGAIGVLSSAKCTNEENYLMQKFARQVIGTHNVDHCARLCHSSTVAGLAACFGSGAMSNTMADVACEAESILIIGSNTTEQHPVFGTMLRQAVLNRNVKIVVADPRKIEITEFATLHLQQKPGTDVALINGLMQIILENGWQDETFISERSEGFQDFADTVRKYKPEMVSEITGVPVEALQQAAEILALNKPMAVIWAMGITQHTTGVLNVLSLGNLQMLLGNMGIRGGGVNPLRGQNNVQGACDLGGLPNVFPGYQAVTNPQIQNKFVSAWQLEREGWLERDTATFSFHSDPGLTVTEMIDKAGDGELRALYILAENPLMTDPDINHVRSCMMTAEFVVLQEIFPSETAHYADVLLPATSWAEKSGTFTNTERRVQLIQPAVAPPGNARPDWQIISDLARRVIALEGRTEIGPQSGWSYQSASEVLDEVVQVTPIYGGVSHKRLEGGDQLHWPVLDQDHPGTPILHIGKFTRGLGKFHSCDHLPAEELPDDEYPLFLTTGRVLYHWHGAEMTRRSKGLLAVYPETLVEISPEDAARIGLNGKKMIRVVSRRGEMVAKAQVTDRVSPGLVFGNFHFPDEQNVNNLTIAALDPVAKIPEYKVCAVRIEAV
jgi:formate dehydrogenase alpha subunit